MHMLKDPLRRPTNSQYFFAALFALMIEAILSSETSLLTRATRHHIQEDGCLQFPLMFLLVFLSCSKYSCLSAVCMAHKRIKRRKVDLSEV
jgi:hypothetical protein